MWVSGEFGRAGGKRDGTASVQLPDGSVVAAPTNPCCVVLLLWGDLWGDTVKVVRWYSDGVLQ